jgi:hypothetical protein
MKFVRQKPPRNYWRKAALGKAGERPESHEYNEISKKAIDPNVYTGYRKQAK